MDFSGEISKKQGLIGVAFTLLVSLFTTALSSSSSNGDIKHIEKNLTEYRHETTERFSDLNIEMAKREVWMSQMNTKVNDNEKAINSVDDLRGSIIELQVTIRGLAAQVEKLAEDDK